MEVAIRSARCDNGCENEEPQATLDDLCVLMSSIIAEVLEWEWDKGTDGLFTTCINAHMALTLNLQLIVRLKKVNSLTKRRCGDRKPLCS